MPTYEVRYIFPSRLAFSLYNKNVAPGLKAAGIAKFAGHSLAYSRSVGDVYAFAPVPPFAATTTT